MKVTFESKVQQRHNPYFNRWFSAIEFDAETALKEHVSQSLF